MKVRALNTFVTDVEMKKGQVKDLDNDRANYFIRMGLVEEVKAEKKKDKKEEKANRTTKEEKGDNETK